VGTTVVDDLFLTLNAITVTTAIVTGLLFGKFAFVPLIRRVVPAGDNPQPLTPLSAFWGTFGVIAFLLGVVVTVFYAEQIVTEIVVALALLGQGIVEALPFRALGRYLAFITFTLAFACGVAWDVYVEFKQRHQTPFGSPVPDQLEDQDEQEQPEQ
jgi:hypothetical protein